MRYLQNLYLLRKYALCMQYITSNDKICNAVEWKYLFLETIFDVQSNVGLLL